MPEFVSYQRAYSSPDDTDFNRASPNLEQLAKYAKATWAMTNDGIYNKRPIRGGTAWSSHAYGAAVDLRYTKQDHVETVVIPWLIANAPLLGIQRIHHYRRQRYWEAGKGWVERSPGQGDNWIHVETHPDRWHDSTPIQSRLNGSQTAPAAPSAPTSPKYPGKPLKRGSKGQAVQAIQTALRIAADGNFGPQTETKIKEYQASKGLLADGVVGPKTWASLFGT
jgi:hypothetical protein